MMKVNLSKPLLFIDNSYLIFYKFYATIQWFKASKQKTDIPSDYNWIDDTIFMNKFKKLYLPAVDKIVKKQKLDIPYSNYIFAKDCSRKDIWRTKTYQEYKIQREEVYKSNDWKGGPIFSYVNQTLLPELQSKHKFHIVNHPHLEADDIVACFTRHIQKTLPKQKIYIITSDHDYLQLINDTTIINLKNKILNEKSCGNPKHDLLIKIICGDGADNIKGCFKRCGYKTALKLVKNPELLEKRFQKEKGSKKIFEENTRLIDFNYIPSNLVESLLNKNKII